MLDSCFTYLSEWLGDLGVFSCDVNLKVSKPIYSRDGIQVFPFLHQF